MRKTKVPPTWRAYAQLNRAVRMSPTCGVPVGEGQKRTRTAPERAPSSAVLGAEVSVMMGSSLSRRPVADDGGSVTLGTAAGAAGGNVLPAAPVPVRDA